MSDLFQSLADAIPSDIRKGVERELINGFNRERIAATIKAKQNAVFEQNNPHTSSKFGRKIASIPLEAYYYWSTRLGPDCWKDDQFLKEFMRDNPEVVASNYQKRTRVNGAVFDANGKIVQ